MAILHQLLWGSYPSGVVDPSWTLALAATGTGAGVAAICVTASAATTATLDGAGYFYTDAAGTLNQSQSWTLAVGSNTRYLRLASGTAHLTFADGSKITKFSGDTGYPSGYSGSTNAPMCSTTAEGVPSSIVWIVYDSACQVCAISGDISALQDSVSRLQLVSLNNSLTGTFANTSATRLESPSSAAHSFDVTGATGLTIVARAGGGAIVGSVTGLTSLTRMNTGTSDGSACNCSGNLGSLLACTDLFLRQGSSSMTYPTTGVTHTGTKSRWHLRSQMLTQAEGDALIIDLSAVTWVASGGSIALRVTGGLSGSAAVTAALETLRVTKNVTVTIYTT